MPYCQAVDLPQQEPRGQGFPIWARRRLALGRPHRVEGCVSAEVPNARNVWRCLEQTNFSDCFKRCLRNRLSKVEENNPSLRTWGRFWWVCQVCQVCLAKAGRDESLTFWLLVSGAWVPVEIPLRSCLATNESIALVWVEGLDFTWAKDDLKLLKLCVVDGSSLA